MDPSSIIPLQLIKGVIVTNTMRYLKVTSILQGIFPFYRSINLRWIPCIVKYVVHPPITPINVLLSMDSLVDRLDRSTFRVDEGPQWHGGVLIGRGGYQGVRTGRRGPVRCYNFYEKWNLVRYFPLPRRPLCAHYRITPMLPNNLRTWLLNGNIMPRREDTL